MQREEEGGEGEAGTGKVGIARLEGHIRTMERGGISARRGREKGEGESEETQS